MADDINVNNIRAGSIRSDELRVERMDRGFPDEQQSVLDKMKDEFKNLEHLVDIAKSTHETKTSIDALSSMPATMTSIHQSILEGFKNLNNSVKNNSTGGKVVSTYASDSLTKATEQTANSILSLGNVIDQVVKKMNDSTGQIQGGNAGEIGSINQLHNTLIGLPTSIAAAISNSLSNKPVEPSSETADQNQQRAARQNVATARSIAGLQEQFIQFIKGTKPDSQKNDWDRFLQYSKSVASQPINELFQLIKGTGGLNSATQTLQNTILKYESAQQAGLANYEDFLFDIAPIFRGKDSLKNTVNSMANIAREGIYNPITIFGGDVSKAAELFRETRNSFDNEALVRMSSTVDKTDLILRILGNIRMTDPTAMLEQRETRDNISRQLDWMQLIAENTGITAENVAKNAQAVITNTAELQALGSINEEQAQRINYASTIMSSSGMTGMYNLLMKAVNAGTFEQFQSQNLGDTRALLKTGTLDEFRMVYEAIMNQTSSNEELGKLISDIATNMSSANLGRVIGAQTRRESQDVISMLTQKPGPFRERDKRETSFLNTVVNTTSDLYGNMGALTDAIKTLTTTIQWAIGVFGLLPLGMGMGGAALGVGKRLFGGGASLIRSGAGRLVRVLGFGGAAIAAGTSATRAGSSGLRASEPPVVGEKAPPGMNVPGEEFAPNRAEMNAIEEAVRNTPKMVGEGVRTSKPFIQRSPAVARYLRQIMRGFVENKGRPPMNDLELLRYAKSFEVAGNMAKSPSVMSRMFDAMSSPTVGSAEDVLRASRDAPIIARGASRLSVPVAEKVIKLMERSPFVAKFLKEVFDDFVATKGRMPLNDVELLQYAKSFNTAQNLLKSPNALTTILDNLPPAPKAGSASDVVRIIEDARIARGNASKRIVQQIVSKSPELARGIVDASKLGLNLLRSSWNVGEMTSPRTPLLPDDILRVADDLDIPRVGPKSPVLPGVTREAPVIERIAAQGIRAMSNMGNMEAPKAPSLAEDVLGIANDMDIPRAAPKVPGLPGVTREAPVIERIAAQGIRAISNRERAARAGYANSRATAGTMSAEELSRTLRATRPSKPSIGRRMISWLPWIGDAIGMSMAGYYAATDQPIKAGMATTSVGIGHAGGAGLVGSLSLDALLMADDYGLIDIEGSPAAQKMYAALEERRRQQQEYQIETSNKLTYQARMLDPTGGIYNPEDYGGKPYGESLMAGEVSLPTQARMIRYGILAEQRRKRIMKMKEQRLNPRVASLSPSSIQRDTNPVTDQMTHYGTIPVAPMMPIGPTFVPGQSPPPMVAPMEPSPMSGIPRETIEQGFSDLSSISTFLEGLQEPVNKMGDAASEAVNRANPDLSVTYNSQ